MTRSNPPRGCAHDQLSAYGVDIQLRKGFDAIGDAPCSDPRIDLEHPRAEAVHPAHFDVTKDVLQSKCRYRPNSVITQFVNLTRGEAYRRGDKEMLENRRRLFLDGKLVVHH